MAAVKPLLTLAVARRIAGVTQEELARQLGVAQASLSYWESGAYPLPEKYAKRIVRMLRPKLEERSAVTDATGAALRGLSAFALGRPWDAVLLAAAAGLEEVAG